MNSIEIPEKNIYTEYPECWEEIAEKDAAFVGAQLHALELQKIDVDVFRKQVVDRFINRRNGKNPPMEGSVALDFWGNESKIADTVNFFFKITTEDIDGVSREQYEVIPNFFKNLYPRIKVGLFCYYGPGDFFGEVSFDEFKDYLLYSSKWMETKDESYLDALLAVGYRRKRRFLRLRKMFGIYNGRERIRYIAESTGYNARKFRDVPIGIKYIFFQYVMGCLYMLKTDADGAGIEVDGHAIPFSLLFNKRGRDDDDDDSGIGLNGVKLALAETGVFGDVEKTGNADVWEVLQRMYQLEMQRREQESKYRR